MNEYLCKIKTKKFQFKKMKVLKNKNSREIYYRIIKKTSNKTVMINKINIKMRRRNC